MKQVKIQKTYKDRFFKEHGWPTDGYKMEQIKLQNLYDWDPECKIPNETTCTKGLAAYEPLNELHNLMPANQFELNKWALLNLRCKIPIVEHISSQILKGEWQITL